MVVHCILDFGCPPQAPPTLVAPTPPPPPTIGARSSGGLGPTYCPLWSYFFLTEGLELPGQDENPIGRSEVIYAFKLYDKVRLYSHLITADIHTFHKRYQYSEIHRNKNSRFKNLIALFICLRNSSNCGSVNFFKFQDIIKTVTDVGFTGFRKKI
jgi:hypothetical protein